MLNTLVIGAGGVGAATAHKCAQHNGVLGEICLASRTLPKCDRIAASIREMGNLEDPSIALHTASVDAMNSDAVAQLIRSTGSGMVLNVASPYCNLSIMEACLATGASYLDTAVYEKEGVLDEAPPWYANYEWRYRDRFADKGITGILGIGFDPGAVNAFCAHANKHLLDTIDTIDIMDVNAGDHGRYFATNFDPETNLREIMEDVLYWEDGKWQRIPCHSKSRSFDFPRVGEHKIYSMGHDELHSLAYNIPARRIEFWMGFGERYIQVFTALKELGFLGQAPVQVDGTPVIPIRMVKALLPDPSTLAENYTGEVCIGCLIAGTKDGAPRTVFVYTTCEHAHCFQDVGSQAISYTTAVPAVTAALLMRNGAWNVGRLVNVEELDPDPFMDMMPQLGLNWAVREE